MSASPSPNLQRIVIADRYLVRGKLGSGSVGSVYLVFDELERREVALKILRTEALLRRSAARMQEEFRAIAELEHPQIARAHDFGYTDRAGVPFYTREYVPGRPLPPGPPGGESPEVHLRPILDLLEALEHVHSRGILHLDIHAGNLILADDPGRGGVLIDFGVAPTAQAAARSAGAAGWATLPPELLSGKTPTAASDVYLVGRLLFYRLTGRQTGAPRLPREISGWGARRTLELERILEKSQQPCPGERFASAAEFRVALVAAIGCAPGPRSRAMPRSNLVGRDAEVGRLDRALETALEGMPAVFCIAGPSGIGKTRLLEEARLRSQLRGLETLSLGFARGANPGVGLSRTLRRLATRRRSEHSWLSSLLPSHGGTPLERARRASAAFFLEEGRPLVLVLDDIDQADRESSMLIECLISECLRRANGSLRGRGLVLLVSTGLDRAPRLMASCRVVLQPLQREASRRLLVSLIQPLSLPPNLVRTAIAAARGSPLRLRRLALAIREEWGGRRVIPSTVELPLAAMEGPRFREWNRLSPDERAALGTLSILGRPASVEDLAVAADLPRQRVARSLRRLTAFEVTIPSGKGAGRTFFLAGSATDGGRAPRPPRKEVRRVHERIVRHLESKPHATLSERDHLARHLLALGRRAEGVRLALSSARELQKVGSRGRALELLERAGAMARGRGLRLEVLELISDLLDETGDHRRAVSLLEPLTRSGAGRLDARVSVRLARRLGTHYHRGGLPEKALRVFDGARDVASPSCDVKDLILIESEVAELQIFQGNLRQAEEACERGLRLLERVHEGAGFRGRMEVMLRASLGHIELRRLRFDSAREELKRSLMLSRKHGTPGDRTAILLNLGVVANEASDFKSARTYFEEADRLLARVGASQDLIKVSTNLALTAAKLGDRAAAELHLERAGSLLKHFPVQRLECFTVYSRGLVRHLFGDCEEALDALEEAISLSLALGDHVMASFARIHAAESALFAGRYGVALSYLQAVRGKDAESLPVLDRMLASRRFLLETLLGRRRQARRAMERVEEIPRGEVLYLETWNEFFVGLGLHASGENAIPAFERCQDAFERMLVTSGARLARLGILSSALRMGDDARLRAVLGCIEVEERTPHRVLQVAEPLLVAEARLALKDVEGADERLRAAGSAIVGLPFIELDWRLELLRSQCAILRGDFADGRRHLHRATHSRSLLLELVPAHSRKGFLAHPRFAALLEAERRLCLLPAREPSTERIRLATGLDGLLGQSAAMLELFRQIQRLAGQDLPLLISGETGTGKELVTRAVHRRSARRDKPFRVVHCACLPPELFESELFGHIQGAFTGAEKDQVGLLEAAAGGTILLDDIHLLPIASQAKLLGVLESRSFRKVGSVEPNAIDARFLATTSQDLKRSVAESGFLEALYYRLARVELSVPPLRERRDDIPLLARHFLDQHAARLDRPVSILERDAEDLLRCSAWPGNVRELETVLLRALITLSRPERISAADLKPFLRPDVDTRVGAAAPRGSLSRSRAELLERKLDAWRGEIEREYIIALFLELRGDIHSVASKLEVSRTRLYDWCLELGIDIRSLRKDL